MFRVSLLLPCSLYFEYTVHTQDLGNPTTLSIMKRNVVIWQEIHEVYLVNLCICITVNIDTHN